MNRAYFLAQGGAFGVAEFAEAKEKATYTYGTGPDTIAYNGPFLITSFTEKNTMVFSANPTYYAPEKMGVHSLVWKFDDGTDATKTYNDMKAGDIDAAALNTSTMEIAKEDGLFDDYAAVSETDATSFVAWLNVNRKAYANYNDSTLGVSEQTDEMKELVRAAMLNVHFRRAVHYAIDRATANAQRRGEDLKYNSLINAYVPGNFVYLEHDVTVDINGTATTFPAGTAYGEIRQAQLEADGSHIKAFDAETGLGTGFDGWYNPEVAAKELAIYISRTWDEQTGTGIATAKCTIVDQATVLVVIAKQRFGREHTVRVVVVAEQLCLVNCGEEAFHLGILGEFLSLSKCVVYVVAPQIGACCKQNSGVVVKAQLTIAH